MRVFKLRRYVSVGKAFRDGLAKALGMEEPAGGDGTLKKSAGNVASGDGVTSNSASLSTDSGVAALKKPLARVLLDTGIDIEELDRVKLAELHRFGQNKETVVVLGADSSITMLQIQYFEFLKQIRLETLYAFKHEIGIQLAINNPNLGNPTPAEVEAAVNDLMELSGYDRLSDLAGYPGNVYAALKTIAQHGNSDWARLSPRDVSLLTRAYFLVATHRLWSGCNTTAWGEIQQVLKGSYPYILAKQFRDEGAHLPLTKMSRVVDNKSALEVAWTSYTSATAPLLTKDVLGTGPARVDAAALLEQVARALNSKDNQRFPLVEALLASVTHMKGRGIC
ncbi:hypothetical protein SELMODRAFT_448992 [Selaginella moellendorffii]|uniref:Uncharacterized protein n=1 Tax=Selaginella moellendorffii TaxID=88036 RepID=D8TBV3_SELML|nr:uncharacterized protein LOC9652243 [Selaginella moellendorffii]XP_024522502.1 uncharacterized protein LOC9652243 [Selaginella moellendorffii]XP_024522503.1 uncharacterized protein LOC9652243 [Selaginella moellendorffii]XP_024522504.1 uncharacterized protein LOC9652243 [Selaginella moellendorffii]EFJ05912.1 hypothetical protein SELMODRAFT_448992 [Selaginella moellendorffii]|eukprot:XP_002993073.1 uncharacterized protein LOC9652243 [Selaginella moellendorffii]